MFFFADPEELLQSLLSQTLKAAPFLELSSGQTAHLYQLFVERDESKSLPSVQELFEQSFLTSGIKLKRVPSVLILQMPRFGRQFKVYDRILPSQILDVTDVIEDGKYVKKWFFFALIFPNRVLLYTVYKKVQKVRQITFPIDRNICQKSVKWRDDAVALYVCL